jgi:uncharacterized protein
MTQRIQPHVKEKYKKLKAYLKDLGKVVIAFSGGVDSTFLLKTAHDVLGDDVLAVIASSETYPEREKKEAIRLAGTLNVRYKLIFSSELENPDFIKNSPERCYFCKKELFSKIKKIAKEEGFPHVLDGANFEDTGDFRPGMKATEELDVRSPLKDVQLVKEEIRALSFMLGLPTWDKPSMACLSSRFPYYTEIEKKSIRQVSQAEDFLRSLGFSQIRVRHHGITARIEIELPEINRIVGPETRDRIVNYFKKIGYTYVTLDLAGYRTGSMNEPILSSRGE